MKLLTNSDTNNVAHTYKNTKMFKLQKLVDACFELECTLLPALPTQPSVTYIMLTSVIIC